MKKNSITDLTEYEEAFSLVNSSIPTLINSVQYSSAIPRLLSKNAETIINTDTVPVCE